MLDFVIFAFTAVIGMIVILLFCWLGEGKKGQQSLSGTKETEQIPRWTTKPADPQLGDLGELGVQGSLHEYLLHLHDHGRCPVTSFWWGEDHVVSVCSPQGFKDTSRLTNRPGKLFKGFEPLIGPASIQYANDSDWEDRKKCLYPKFIGEDLKSYFPHFVQIAQETEARWLTYAPDQRVPLTKETFTMTIKGIAVSCLGNIFQSKEEIERLAEAYHVCWGEMERRIKEGDPEPGSEQEVEFQRSLQYLKDVVQRILQARQEGGDPIPFIDALTQSGVPEEQLISDTISFMVGGFHTSGNFFAWLLCYLAQHPEVQERLREDVEREVGGERGDRLKEYALDPKTYMRQVQDETLRMSTLGPWAARYSNEDLSVAGYTVPAQTPIIHALGVALKNETSWQDVHSFDPDRFAPNGPHGRRGLEFCPFGVPSRRKCPGYQFSYFEVAVFASILLPRFSIVLEEGQEVQQKHGLVTEPREEIYVHLRPREAEE